MCPIWPLHLIILYVLAICPLWVLCQAAPELTANFVPSIVDINMQEYKYVDVNVQGTNLQTGDVFSVSTRNTHIAEAEFNSTAVYTGSEDSTWRGRIRITGNFLGRTDVTLQAHRGSQQLPITNSTLPVIIVRPQRVIDTIFTTSVATF
ncbi:hypothetical protein O3G_MSEX005863, partial [Manduca sexta]